MARLQLQRIMHFAQDRHIPRRSMRSRRGLQFCRAAGACSKFSIVARVACEWCVEPTGGKAIRKRPIMTASRIELVFPFSKCQCTRPP